VKRWEAVLVALNLRDLPLRDDDTEYPPFKRVTPCPKCGFNGVRERHDGHTITFVPARTEVRGTFRVSCPERVYRRCFDCGAEWYQLPWDASRKAEG
jgi:hypothetical protein